MPLTRIVAVIALVLLGCAARQREQSAPREQAQTARTETVLVVERLDEALPEIPAPVDSMFACNEDTDCVVLELGCCDHCNGGALLAVGVGYIDDADARFRERDCTMACTERGCAYDYQPVCDAGTCARLETKAGMFGEERQLVHNFMD